MTAFVALLRGINVGGKNKVEMPKLKAAFQTMGFEDVLTYINTGNVIFKTAGGVNNLKIEKILEKTFGFNIKVILREKKHIDSLCKKIPENWLNDDSQKTDVLFLSEEFDSKKTLNLIKVNLEVDNLQYLSGSIVWNVKREDYAKSGMKKFIGTEVYKNMTARNVNTVRKLGELM
jgi:uncharacterized protein (DUF1697 family)